jgi:hypothetical protein
VAIATIYSLFAFFVVIIYLRLYLISRETGVKFRVFVELIHPVMQVMMFLSVLNLQGGIGRTIAFVGAVGFSLAAVPFLFNILIQWGVARGVLTKRFIAWFDLDESVEDSLIHAILSVGMAVTFLPHDQQPQILTSWLITCYVAFLARYLLKLTPASLLRILNLSWLIKKRSWTDTMKIWAHIIMIGSMIMHHLVHALPNFHTH